MGYSIIAIIGLLLDLKTYGPFAVACCFVFFKFASVIRMVIDVMYEQRIKFCFVQYFRLLKSVKQSEYVIAKKKNKLELAF